MTDTIAKEELWAEMAAYQARFEQLMLTITRVGQEQQLRLNEVNQLKGRIDYLKEKLDDYVPKSLSEQKKKKDSE